MKIIIDTNRIIASLIKEGLSRKILFNKNFTFLSPSYAMTEISRHKKEIISKANITKEEFDTLLVLVFENISVIPKEEYSEFYKQAGELITDKADIPFIALCLSEKADGIWSDDSHFADIRKIKIFRTVDMVGFI